jgi:hypothetical protein
MATITHAACSVGLLLLCCHICNRGASWSMFWWHYCHHCRVLQVCLTGCSLYCHWPLGWSIGMLIGWLKCCASWIAGIYSRVFSFGCFKWGYLAIAWAVVWLLELHGFQPGLLFRFVQACRFFADCLCCWPSWGWSWLLLYAAWLQLPLACYPHIAGVIPCFLHVMLADARSLAPCRVSVLLASSCSCWNGLGLMRFKMGGGWFVLLVTPVTGF